jgi:hypothetical protein
MDFATVYISAPDPNDGDVVLRLEWPIVAGASVPPITDAELIDIGNRLVASDYIQDRNWTGGAALVSISVPNTRAVYP